MTTINKELLTELSDLVFSIMDSTDIFDMSVVETLTEDFMQQHDLHFKDYNQLILEVDPHGDEASYHAKFESTADYFFEQVNSMAIKQSRVYSLVEMCVEC